MKKLLICLFVAAAIFSFSCASEPQQTEQRPAQQTTQNDEQEQVYDNYRSKLDLTGARNYTVVKGDTLSEITRAQYGNLTGVGNAGKRNGFYFPVIILASDANIADPDLIEPGMQLRIPDLRRNLDNSETRKAIKDCLQDIAGVYSRKGEKQYAKTTNEGLRALSGSL